MKQRIGFPMFISILLFILLTGSADQTSDFAPKGILQEKVADESLEVDWWPMFRHDLSHTGFSTSDAPSSNDTLWIYETRHQIMSSPAVFEGVVFIGSYDHNLYALNATTGLLIWKYETDGTIFSSPSVENGKVFVSSSDGRLYALNASTREYIWSFEFWGLGHSSPAVVNSKVFIGSGFDKKVYALDANTGSAIWNFTTEGSIISSPAIANDILYVGSTDDKIYALNASTGALIWRYTTGDSVRSSPCIGEGKVFIGSDDGNVYALDANTGALIWSFATYPHGQSSTISSSPAFSEGKVYVGTFQAYPDHLFALNASTGVSIWNFTGGFSFSSPAVADDKVFIMNYGGQIYALNATNGTYVWSYDTGGSASTSSPAVVDGKVFVGSGNGKVYCFGPMLYFNIEIDPMFYDNRGEPFVSLPSSWNILFPNGTSKTAYGPEIYYGQMGTYSIGNIIWKGREVFTRKPVSIFLDSNLTWNPRIDCILPTTLSLSLSSSTSYVGFKIEIDGNLTCNEKGVSSAPILLSYSVTTGKSWNDITLVETGIDGNFSAVWMPSATGNYLVKAIWDGNSTFPATSGMVNLAVIPFQEQNVFSVTSNSTITALSFDSESRELSFNVTGPSGTIGCVNVYIAKSLIADIEGIEVKLNEEEAEFTVTSLDDSWLLTFTCQHSTHTVIIALGSLPASFIETPLGKVITYAGVPFIVAIALAILYRIRKTRRHSKPA